MGLRDIINCMHTIITFLLLQSAMVGMRLYYRAEENICAS